MNASITPELLQHAKAKYGVDALEHASIRQLVMMISELESATGQRFVRMELGVPGLEPATAAREAEHAVLDSPKLAQYPALNGNESLRNTLQAFFKGFLNIERSGDTFIPTAGAMQASLAAFWLITKLDEKKTTLLFLDPGFPTQVQQAKSLGIPYRRLDVFAGNPRNVVAKVREALEVGDIAGIVYSTPNNPVWSCLTSDELRGLAGLCDEFGAYALEDLAYFGMDFREDYSTPGQAPYPPSAAHYTDRCLLMFSGSKLFNYAGQRTGALVLSEHFLQLQSTVLNDHFGHAKFMHALLFGVIQTTTAGLAQAPQAGFEASLKAMLDGTCNPLVNARVYGERAKKLKALLVENGFELLYERDIDQAIADGFYFAFGHPAYPESGLAEALLGFGISATPLTDAGAEHKQGLRACVGLMTDEDLERIAPRLSAFAEAHA